MADEINPQDVKQSQKIITASKAILAVVAVTAVSSVAISRYNNGGASNNTNSDSGGGSAHHMSSNSPQEVSSTSPSDKSLQITQTIQQLNQVSNSLSKESLDIFNTLYNEQAERSSSRRRLSMSESSNNEGKLLRGLSAKQSTLTKVSSQTMQKISLNNIKQSQQKQSEQKRKLGRGVGMKRPKGHNMLQNMDNKWSSSSNDSHHSEDTNMLQRYRSPSWDTWYSDMDGNWNMNTEWGGGKSGKSGHWEYHPSHDTRYWDHPPQKQQWGQPSWNINEWGGGKSGKSGYKYQGWGHEVPVVGWEEHPSYSNWWGHSSSSSEDEHEEEDTLYSTSEVDSETEEVDVTFSASSVAEEDPDDRNGEVEEEAEDGEEGEDGVIINYGYCGVDAEEASRRCKKACTSSSDCKEGRQCFASPSCDPDAVAEGKMNRNGDAQFEELDRQVEFGQMDADGNMVEVAAADADESSTSFTSSAMVEEEETFFSASSVQEEESMYSSSSAFANAHYQVSSPQEDYESHHSPSQGYYYQEEESGWGGSTEMVECHPVEEVMWSGGRKLYGKASQGWWSQPPPPHPHPSWHQQPAWMGGSKTSKTSGYGFYPSSSNYNYGGTKTGKATWGASQWHQPPPAWSHGPPNPEDHAPVIDHAPQYHQDSPPPQHHPPPVSWNYDPWAKSSKAKSGKTKSGKSCYILVQEPRSSDDFGPSYCGMSFADASNQCSQQCASDGDCPGGASCYGPITSCGGGPFPPSPTPPSPPGVGYCGMSFADASSTCSQQCSSSGDCSAGFNCYGPITSCGGGSDPPPPTPPILPPVVSGYCGMSGGDALNQCSRRCTTSADCSGGAQCFSAPGCLVSNGVCGTSQQDASESCEPSCIDNTDCSGGEQCFPVDISGCGGVISNGFCGSDVGNANEQCNVKCTTDADCSGGGQCFSAPGCLVSNGVCGASFLDAINKCEPTCTSSADCSGSDQCFSVPKDACPSYCGTSLADAESQCAVKCTKNSDCSGGAKCQGPIPNCTPDIDPPTTEPVYCPEGCPDCDPNSPLPCPRVSMKQVCDKHNDELYPPGDPKEGQRIANFNDCYDMCKPSFCCIHDSTSTELSPTCAGNIGPNKYENCPLYYPCYIIWWKLHDTIGPATYLRVEGSEEPFFENLNFETIRQDFIQDKVFFNQLYNHHFDTDDIPTDDTFEDPNNW